MYDSAVRRYATVKTEECKIAHVMTTDTTRTWGEDLGMVGVWYG